MVVCDDSRSAISLLSSRFPGFGYVVEHSHVRVLSAILILHRDTQFANLGPTLLPNR